MCEILGFKEAEELENNYIVFLKSNLGVRKSTPSTSINIELGTHPLSFKLLERMIKYCFKILNLDNGSPIKKIYSILLDDVNKGLTTCNVVYKLKS